MSDSKSRHKGTPQRPRVIHWSPGARFIMAHSGHALSQDPQSNDIEIIQVDEANHSWRFLTMRLTDDGFAAPVDVTRHCTACHGATPRPIWGPYPNWPHAYQGSRGHEGVDRMTPEELQDFGAFVQATKDDECLLSSGYHGWSQGVSSANRIQPPQHSLWSSPGDASCVGRVQSVEAITPLCAACVPSAAFEPKLPMPARSHGGSNCPRHLRSRVGTVGDLSTEVGRQTCEPRTNQALSALGDRPDGRSPS